MKHFHAQLYWHEIDHALTTIVGILTFINMINIKPESLKARKVFIFSAF